jgi:predicted nucleic acid-binding protein
LRLLLDTNVLVRHLTGSPPDQARRATAMLGARRFWLVDLVVAELVYVLGAVYGAPREEVAALLRTVIAQPTISVTDPETLLRAIDLFASGRLDFVEAYLVATAEAAGIEAIASFDQALDRVETVTRIEP